MNRACLVLVGICLISRPADAGVIVGPVEDPANGHDYYLLTQDTWANSQAEAAGLGGNLVTINDQAENDWVFDFFSRAGGSGRALWIGLHRETTGGPFTWVSSEDSLYTHWAPGEPNFPDERFVYMIPTQNANLIAGDWNNDYDRTSSTYGAEPSLRGSIGPFAIHGVVEVVPEPTAIGVLGAGTFTCSRDANARVLKTGRGTGLKCRSLPAAAAHHLPTFVGARRVSIFQSFGSKGFTRRMPARWVKSLTLRVTSRTSYSKAVAAMIASPRVMRHCWRRLIERVATPSVRPTYGSDRNAASSAFRSASWSRV